MKFSDTIIGSIIIGVLVGGAILLSGSDGHDKKHAQIKILKSPSEGKGVRELIHKEIKTTFASHYTQEISFEEMLQPEIIKAYAKQATGEKYLVTPHKE